MLLIYSRYQSNFELSYIKNILLKKISIKKEIILEDIKNKNDKIFNNNHLIFVYSPGDKKVLNSVENFVKNRELTYSLIHLSDEMLNDDIGLYNNAQLIVRNYFNPFIFRKNIYTVPLGFQSGFYLNRNFSEPEFRRNYIWSFAGQIYKNRKNMIKEFESVGNYFIHQTIGFNSKNGIDAMELREIYLDSIFAPCPFGYINADTFRVMEVLESGCIPIVKKYFKLDYYKIIFGDHPFLIVNEWNEATKYIEDFIDNPKELLKKQKEVHEWYKAFKKNLYKDVENLLYGNFKNLNSIQFKYQKKISIKIKTYLKFFFIFRIKNKNSYIIISKTIYKIKQKLKNLLIRK
jgi:hypothetical protein